MVSIKEMEKLPERLESGHKLCPGCGAPLIARHVLKATKDFVVVGLATGCLEVSTTVYPQTAWKVPYIHNAFENVAATISGVETAYRSLVKQKRFKKKVKFVAFGGDGGTYDIGIQSLSGALERGHDFVYVCYNNEAYMNTGIQRSGATPFAADTKTAPYGKVKVGKEQFPKDLTKIVAAHNIPYVAQATLANLPDLHMKAKKAFEVKGPAFLNVLSPCPLGWRHQSDITIELSKIAMDTCFWPIYEIIEGVWKLNYNPSVKKPIEEWIKPQGRYKHLLKPENQHIIEKIQKNIDAEWAKLKKMCGVVDPKPTEETPSQPEASQDNT